MKKMRALVSVVLLALILVPFGQAQKEETQPDQPFEPNYDRELFKKSGTSIARGDLLACRNRDAKITQGGDVNVDEFARTLHGVWVNQNNRSLHGVTIETDNAFYIDMRNGRTGTAVLIDRNNMGDFSLSKPYTTPGNRYRRTSRPLTMSFVNCTFQMIDRYIKVSDEIPLEVLAASTRVQFGRKATLEQAWQRIVASGYFTTFDMLTESREGTARRRVNAATLGDGQRIAVMPDGLRVDEQSIADGLVPGAEYGMPMMVGALFRITLTPQTEGRQFQAVHMRWDAEYRATGVGLKPGDVLHGVEQGIFAREGSAYVSAQHTEMVRTAGSTGTPQPIVQNDGWETDDCGNKNALVNEGSFGQGGEAAPILGHQDHNAPKTHDASLHFERVVIGAPGLETLERRGLTSSTKARPK